HLGFRSEWWYFTGVLRARSAAGGSPRDFGYQVTFFRQALAPAAAQGPSAWRARDTYMAHFALSALEPVGGSGREGPRGRELSTSPFRAAERFARAGNALAGAEASPFAVWTDDWRVDEAGAGRWHVRARAEGMAVDLMLSLGQSRGPILQGPGGLSRKGPAPGQASYYHSWTRIPTEGTVTLAGASTGASTGAASASGADAVSVEGFTWLDREWSTAPLAQGVRGWDWMGLSLTDGRDLMLYVLRDEGGNPIAQSCATVIGPDRIAHLYGPDAFHAKAQGSWTSPDSGVRYPARFAVDLPAASLSLTITPRRPDQELRLAVRYWEGAVAVTGTSVGQPVKGEGYLELTGYDAQRVQ
ncbi:MAG TPA: lipocalin-like domain-containing protein, partial [Polyangia bacterium]